MVYCFDSASTSLMMPTHVQYETLLIRPRKKNCLFSSDRVSKKNLTQEASKKIFSYFFRYIVIQFYSFLYLDSIHYVYLKWFISIKTCSWYICSIFKTRNNFFQYILIHRFITIKDGWTKYRHCQDPITLKCPQCVYKYVFQSSQGGTFKLVNPKHEYRTKRQSGLLSQS